MYKIKFNSYELSTFNTVETVKKTKLMSVYSYLIKNSIENNLTISAEKLHAKYKRYHKGVSLAYFKKLIKNLEELSLIAIDKSKKIRSYFISRAQITTPKVAEKVAEEKEVEPIDIPSLEGNSEKRNTKSLNNSYTNTLYTQQRSQDFGDFVAPVELVLAAKKIMKELRIRSAFVKEKVNQKLSSCYNINRKGMDNYVLKVIIEKKILQEARREAFRRSIHTGVAIKFNKEKPQYTHEQMIDIENKLLGLA